MAAPQLDPVATRLHEALTSNDFDALRATLAPAAALPSVYLPCVLLDMNPPHLEPHKRWLNAAHAAVYYRNQEAVDIIAAAGVDFNKGVSNVPSHSALEKTPAQLAKECKIVIKQWDAAQKSAEATNKPAPAPSQLSDMLLYPGNPFVPALQKFVTGMSASPATQASSSSGGVQLSDKQKTELEEYPKIVEQLRKTKEELLQSQEQLEQLNENEVRLEERKNKQNARVKELEAKLKASEANVKAGDAESAKQRSKIEELERSLKKVSDEAEQLRVKAATEEHGAKSVKGEVRGSGRHPLPYFVAYDEIVVATDQFAPANILGTDSMGPTYKATLVNLGHVQIKVVEGTALGSRNFLGNAVQLYFLRHPHLSPLRAVCMDGPSRCLLFTSMPVYSKLTKSSAVERLRVAYGLAAGLAHMHSLGWAHCNLSAEAVGCDRFHNSRLSMLEFARPVEADEAITTTSVLGTIGYIDPSVYVLGTYTHASDVYSFGVIMLELLAGRPALAANSMPLVQALTKEIAAGAEQLANAAAMPWKSSKSGSAFAAIIITCLHVDAAKRPTAKQLATQLRDLLGNTESFAGASTLKNCLLCLGAPRSSAIGSCSCDAVCAACADILVAAAQGCPLCGVPAFFSNKDTAKANKDKGKGKAKFVKKK